MTLGERGVEADIRVDTPNTIANNAPSVILVTHATMRAFSGVEEKPRPNMFGACLDARIEEEVERLSGFRAEVNRRRTAICFDVL
jgi:hypothetical protein